MKRDAETLHMIVVRFCEDIARLAERRNSDEEDLQDVKPHSWVLLVLDEFDAEGAGTRS